MAENERPLPKPPRTPFGKGRSDPESGGQGLLADKMAEAAALGNLDEYLEQELPDSEEARALARMMMSMTGMMPTGSPPAPREGPAAAGSAESGSASLPPEDLLRAVQGGDVKGIMGILRREHERRSPGTEPGPAPAEAEAPAKHPSGEPRPAIDKALIDALIRIASDNSVTLDWIILRAIKVYVEEYGKTGKL